MTKVLERLSAKKREQDLVIPVTLPGYSLHGVAHAEVRLTATVTDELLVVNLSVSKENGDNAGGYRAVISATDLGLSPNRRTAEYMRTKEA